MIRTIINKHNVRTQLFLVNCRRTSRLIILQYPMNHKEQVIDSYLRKNYKKSLKEACLLIWNNCRFYENNNNVDVILTDKDLDKLYQIITFGVGKIQGSEILQSAFN